jgi:hypothetical protein
MQIGRISSFTDVDWQLQWLHVHVALELWLKLKLLENIRCYIQAYGFVIYLWLPSEKYKI